MKRFLMIVLAVLMMFSAAMAEEIHTLVEQNGLYGLNDAQGNVVIPSGLTEKSTLPIWI